MRSAGRLASLLRVRKVISHEHRLAQGNNEEISSCLRGKVL